MHSNEWGLISLNVYFTKNGSKLRPCITPPSGCRTVAASVVCPREFNRILHVPEGPALPSGALSYLQSLGQNALLLLCSFSGFFLSEGGGQERST